jgi:hypothetical protein
MTATYSNYGASFGNIGSATAVTNKGLVIGTVGGAESTTTAALELGAVTAKSGSTAYGMNVGNVSGGTTNYAIKTGTGLVDFGGKLSTVATASGSAGFKLPHGTAPSSPVDGDMWTTTSGAYVRINGSTIGPLASSAGASVDWANPGNIGATTPAAGTFTTLASTGAATLNSAIVTTTASVGGDIALNGDDVTSTQATVNLWNATPTTINFGGNATTMAIGKDGGAVTGNGTWTIDNGVIGGVVLSAADISNVELIDADPYATLFITVEDYIQVEDGDDNPGEVRLETLDVILGETDLFLGPQATWVTVGAYASFLGDTYTQNGDLEVTGASTLNGVSISGVSRHVTITTFTANDTTPTVAAGNLFKVPGTWTAGNNITAFDNGLAGQEIVIIGGDSDCIVVDGAYLVLAGNWTASAGDTLRLTYDGTYWNEECRSNN